MAGSLSTRRVARLEIERVGTLAGPNIWSSRPLLELRLIANHFGELDRLAADVVLKSLSPPVDTVSGDPGRKQADFAAVSLAEWFSSAVVGLQSALGSPVEFHCWEPTETRDVLRVFVEFEEEKLAALVIQTLQTWVNSLSDLRPATVADDWRQLQKLAYDLRLGNTTGAIVAAATARGIPHLRLDDESLVQLGQGYLQHRIRMAVTDRTSSIGNCIATDKQLAKSLLQTTGIPVPEGRVVSDAEDACDAAADLGWPVVVKPVDADYGDGVSIHLTTKEQVQIAYAAARKWSERVMVERFVSGSLYRLLIVDGRLVAAVRREAAFVVGDGRRTVLQLVRDASNDPLRGPAFVWPNLANGADELPPLAVDDRSNSQVPAAGQTVAIRRDVFLRYGGWQVDRTKDVHPDIITLALDASCMIGLDIAGIDLLADDITKPPHEQNFAMLEVNPEPALVIHMSPLCDPAPPVADAIVDSMFASGIDGRLPLIAVLGSQDAMEIAQRLVTDHRRQGTAVGFASREGAWLNGMPLGTSCGRISEHAQRLCRHPRTELLVVHLSLADIVREGVPFDHCDQLIEVETGEPVFSGINDAHSLEAHSLEERRALDCVRSCLSPAGTETAPLLQEALTR